MKNFDNRKKILRLSAVAQMLCFVVMFAFVLLGLRAAIPDVGVIVATRNHVREKAGRIVAKETGQPIEAPSQTQKLTALAYMLVDPPLTYNLPEAIVGFVVTLNLYRLFKRLRSGCLFDDKAVARLHTAGKWCVGYGIGISVLNLIVTLTTPAIAFPSVGALLVGAILFIIAGLFREAKDLQDERQLTV